MAYIASTNHQQLDQSANVSLLSVGLQVAAAVALQQARPKAIMKGFPHHMEAFSSGGHL